MTLAKSVTPAGVIRSDRRGRLLVRAEQWALVLEAFDASSLSGMAFCRQHGLIESAKRHGHDLRLHGKNLNAAEPHAYLKDILERLPAIRTTGLDALLPANWQPRNESTSLTINCLDVSVRGFPIHEEYLGFLQAYQAMLEVGALNFWSLNFRE